MEIVQKQKIQEYLVECVKDGVFPGACVLVTFHGEKTYFCVGNKALLPKCETNHLKTIYDLASLSKVVVTTPIILKLIEEGFFTLNTNICDILDDFPFQDIEILDLLTHTSGLPADTTLQLSDDKDVIWKKICTCERLEKRGSKVIYSDLGFITLGKVAETVLHMQLAEIAKKYIFDPLEMKNTMYCPSEEWIWRCAPTEYSIHFHRLLKGEVHDRKAYLMQGVAGHAGVFSTIEDMSHVIDMHLYGGVYKGVRILNDESMKLFRESRTPKGDINRSIGFTLKDERSPFAKQNSDIAYMHTGFTGTSMLLDPMYELGIVILSNRVHPSREQEAIIKCRKMIHQHILNVLEI